MIFCVDRHQQGGMTCRQYHRASFEFWCDACCRRHDSQSARESARSTRNDPSDDEKTE